MHTRYKVLLFSSLCLALGHVSVAQDNGRRQGSGGRSPRGAMVSSRSGPSYTGGSNSTSAPRVVRASPSRGSVSSGRTRGTYSTSGAGGLNIPSQTYSPNYRWSWSYWNDTNWFVYRLMRQYRFLPGYNYLWRFRQGDSPLTPRSVQLALQQCRTASASMLRISDQLEGLISQYEAGELSHDEFERQVEQTTKRIRSFAKKIRKDDFLDFLDQRQNHQVDSFQEADSLLGLRALAQQLRMMVTEVDSGLNAFHHQDMTRVVDVKELQRTSFDALSKGIDRLAKTIDRSAGRL